MLLIIAGIILLVIAITAVVFLLMRKKADAPAVANTVSVEAKKTGVESIEGRYLFSGTIVLARAVEREAKGNYEQPFSGLSTLNPDEYDAWIADLECPSTGDTVSYQEQVANLVFNCPTAFLPSLAKYFDILNLANNHTNDMGADGFKETQVNLEKAGIQTYGNFNPAEKDDICEVIALPVRVKKADGQVEKGTIPIAFCAWQYFFRTPLPGEIETMERYAKVMPVFGFMHAGVEYVANAGADQVGLGKKIIDEGSEFVIGNSPHWVQNTEAYKNKLIFYSTGNFIFDQLDSETQRGASVDVSMKISENTTDVDKWLELGEACKPRLDDCLEKAEQAKLTKLKTDLTYDVVATSGGVRKVTKKADAAVQASVEQRTNWLLTLKGIGQEQ